ncbi:13324_t:CDS:2 [Funneliformis caledonium]|uniref:13324_t:CDS:1 n=1 Tax=Funneliformis caledonium TaxID=1117310 RepID=A0A9N9GVG8_9GLOM|nr:13324_t:CDS:2 [Funneliformis caledonium]
MQHTNHIISSQSFSKSTRILIVFILSLILFLSTLIEAAPPSKRDNKVSVQELKELERFANYASAAYCKPSDFLKWDCGPICDATKGTKVSKFITTKSEIQVFIATLDKEKLIVVSYRGTVPENVKNLITDAKLILTDYPPVKDAKVHIGFYQAFLEVQSDVFNEIQKLHKKNPKYKVVFSGHSLGGALTLLSALDLSQNSKDFSKDKNNLFVFTYGEPRVGNSEFADHVNSKLTVSRTVNGGDSIARLPPRFIGYKQHQNELWISDPTKSSFEVVKCDGPEDQKCSLSVSVPKLSLSFHAGPYYGVSMRACKNFSKIQSLVDEQELKKAYEGLGGDLKGKNKF